MQIGADFAKIYVFVELLDKVGNCIYFLLDTIDKEAFSSYFGMLVDAANTLCLMAVAVTNEASLNTVGYVFLYFTAGGMIILVMIIMWMGWFDPFLGGMVGTFALSVSIFRARSTLCNQIRTTCLYFSLGTQNTKAVKLMLKTSSSLSLGMLLAYGEWEVLTVFAK